MAQQTAVDWYYEQTVVKGKQNYYELLEQAKQMEKEQIIKSNRDGVDMCVDKKPFITGEQYYKEVYEGQGSPDTTTSPNTQNK